MNTIIKNFYFLMIFSIISFSASGQASFSKETQSYILHQKGIYILQNLTIIDGLGEQPKTNQDILINGELIEAVGVDLPIPENATVINMQGKSAIPGMVMLHEHLFYPKATPGGFGVNQMSYSFPKLYLAGGVTTMRTAGSIMPQADINLKKFIKNGKIPGPKMDVTSPFLDREGTGLIELTPLKSTEEAVEAVNFYADNITG